MWTQRYLYPDPGIAGSPLPKVDRFGDNRVKFGEKYGKGIARH